MKYTGERQVALSLDNIRGDHVSRYKYVASQLVGKERVLDVGCGIGYGSNIIADCAEKVLAIDIDPKTIAFANEHWAHQKIIFVNSDILSLSGENFQDGFDVITAFEVVEHVVFDDGILAKVQMYLKPGGLFFLSVPNQMVVPYSLNTHPFHVRHYLLEEITEKLVSFGFEILEVRYQDKQDFVDSEDQGRFIIIKAVSKRDFNDQPLDLLHYLELANTEIIKRGNCISSLQEKLKAYKQQEKDYLRLSTIHERTLNKLHRVELRLKKVEVWLSKEKEKSSKLEHFFEKEKEITTWLNQNIVENEHERDPRVEKILALSARNQRLRIKNLKLRNRLNYIEGTFKIRYIEKLFSIFKKLFKSN